MSLLQIANISKSFGGIVANREIDMEVQEDEILGIIGPNGSGKTTLFNIITGFILPDQGSISFRGHNLLRKRPDQINALGLVRTFQKLRPFSSMSVQENVMVPLLSHGHTVAEAKPLADDHLEFVGLSHVKDIPAGGLSTGQRKRLELARTMATNPKMLMLDEPTGGVDPDGVRLIVELIHRIKERNVALVVIEHRMKIMASIADRMVALHLGQKIAEGPPAEVLANPKVVSAYLGTSHDA